MSDPTSLTACIDAVELLIAVALGKRVKPRPSELELLATRARFGVEALRKLEAERLRALGEREPDGEARR